MGEAAESGDVARMIDLDTEFHGTIIDASGRHRLGSLWRMLDAQMGALMRSSIDRQHIALGEAVRRHQLLVDIFGVGTIDEIVAAMEEHYLGTVDDMAEAGMLTRGAGTA
jgi:DNA-binding GntR family transcriptional regulator